MKLNCLDQLHISWFNIADPRVASEYYLKTGTFHLATTLISSAAQQSSRSSVVALFDDESTLVLLVDIESAR